MSPELAPANIYDGSRGEQCPAACSAAPSGQLAEPTRENVEAVAAFVAELKYPSTPWRDILSAHICSAHMNVFILDSMEVQQAGRLEGKF